MHMLRKILPVLALLSVVSAAFAQDIKIIERFYNSLPEAQISWYKGGDTVGISATKLCNPTDYCARSDWRLANPDGTELTLGTSDYFMLEADVTTSGSATVECGFIMMGQGWAEGRVMLNTANGAVAGWGGYNPWWWAGTDLFHHNQTVHLGYLYTNEGGLNGVHYYFNGLDSGFLPNTPGNLDPTTIGGYFMPLNDPTNPENNASIMFKNIRFNGQPINAEAVPEPGSLAFLGTGLVGLLGLRRRR